MNATPLETSIVEQAYTQFGIVADDSEILAFVRHVLPLLAPALVNNELRSGLVAALEWIDAVPADTPLPTMPGFDRDDIDKLVDGTKSIAGSPSLLKAARAVLAMEDGPYIGSSEEEPFKRLRAAVDSVQQNASAVENVMRGIRIREVNVSDVEKDLRLRHDRARPSAQTLLTLQELANALNPYVSGSPNENWRRGFLGETFHGYPGSGAEQHYKQGQFTRQSYPKLSATTPADSEIALSDDIKAAKASIASASTPLPAMPGVDRDAVDALITTAHPTPQAVVTNEQAAFEQWMQSGATAVATYFLRKHTRPDCTGDYVEVRVHNMFEAWQARAILAASPAAEVPTATEVQGLAFIEWFAGRFPTPHLQRNNYPFLQEAWDAALSFAAALPQVGEAKAVAYMLRTNLWNHSGAGLPDPKYIEGRWSEWEPVSKKYGDNILENKKNRPNAYWFEEVRPLFYAALVAQALPVAAQDGAWHWVLKEDIDSNKKWVPARRNENHWDSAMFRGLTLRGDDVGPAITMPVAAEARKDAEQCWDDLKIAFSVDEPDNLWAAKDDGHLVLPSGWYLSQTTMSGCSGFVAIFRVESLPSESDCKAVADAIAATQAEPKS